MRIEVRDLVGTTSELNDGQDSGLIYRGQPVLSSENCPNVGRVQKARSPDFSRETRNLGCYVNTPNF